MTAVPLHIIVIAAANLLELQTYLISLSVHLAIFRMANKSIHVQNPSRSTTYTTVPSMSPVSAPEKNLDIQTRCI